MESSAVMGEADDNVCKENTNNEDEVCLNGNISSEDESMEITSDISKAPVKSTQDTIENHKKVPDVEVPMEESDNEPEAEIMDVDLSNEEPEDEENGEKEDGNDEVDHDTSEKKTLTNGTDNSLNNDDDEEDDDDDDVVMEVTNPLETESTAEAEKDEEEEDKNKSVELNDSGDVVLIETDSEHKENGERCKSPDVEEVIDISDKDTDVVSLTTPKKKPPRKSTESTGPPRRSSRNLHKQKSYIEKEDEIEDEIEDEVEENEVEESDIEEILPEDPLADPLRDDKENNKKTKTSTSHPGPTIVVSDTKRLVEIAANSKASNSSGKKEPTLVIIDTNSILSGRGAVPVAQKSTSLSSSFSMLPVALPAQGVYPPNMRATITPIPMTSQSQPQHQPQPKPTPAPPQILPTLTDDMFVVEAPSFIVPYVYEKPPMKPFKEFVAQVAKEIEENKKEREKEEMKKESEKDAEVKSEEKEKEDDKEEKEGEESDDEQSDSSEKKTKIKEETKADNEKDEDAKETNKEEDSNIKIKEENSKDEVKTIDLDEIPDDTPNKPKSNTYFDNALGQFFINIGFNLVQEFVQTDLLKQQKRKNSREGNTSIDTKIAINSLIKNLEYSKENNEPFKLEQKKCEFCSFKTESNLALAHHLETPHMRNYVYKCNFCPLEVRSPHDILFHMEAEHNTRGRLERAPAFHQCPNCPFEDNQKGKLSRHLVTCLKKFKPEKNLEPPADWEPPAKIPRVPRMKQTGLQATAATYQALAQSKGTNAYSMFAKLQSQSNSPYARGRGRPNMVSKINSIRASPPVVRAGNMMFRPGSSGGSVLVPASYQFGGNQVFQVMSGQSEVQGAGKLTSFTTQSTPVALLSSTTNTLTIQNSSGNKNSSGKVVQQPSISITPLPRQTSNATANKPSQAGSQSDSKATFVICEICDGYIKDLEQLRNHMQWIHKVKIHPKMIYNRPPLNCQKCQFRFFTDQGLERHLLGSHGLVTSSMQEAANKSKDAGRCPVCGRVYQWKLLNHVARDHNMTLKPAHLSYKCTVCTATFGMYKQFENHVYSAHSVVAKRVMEKKASSPASRTNDSLLKPLKINDEITIIPQPAKAKTNSASVSRNSDRNSSDRGK